MRKIPYVAVGAAMLALWIAPVLLLHAGVKSWSDAGVIGDSFGLVNSLFSGIALLGVLYTLHQQHRDAMKRDEQFLEDQASSRSSLDQLILSTRLQIITTIVSENRKSILELRPELKEVPASVLMLIDLKSRIQSDERTSSLVREGTSEVIALIDELIAASSEVRDIRAAMQGLVNRQAES